MYRTRFAARVPQFGDAESVRSMAAAIPAPGLIHASNLLVSLHYSFEAAATQPSDSSAFLVALHATGAACTLAMTIMPRMLLLLVAMLHCIACAFGTELANVRCVRAHRPYEKS